MNLILTTIVGISFIFLCTSIGASSVFFLRKKSISLKINQIFLGFSSGIMLSASIFSLILPAINDSNNVNIPISIVVSISVLFGALFLWSIDKITDYFSTQKENSIKTSKFNSNLKMFLAVTIHNIPEGLSVGIAYGIALASWNPNPQASIVEALILAIGIGIQNIPEGAVVSLMYKSQKSTKKSFLLGVLSGAVEPFSAMIGVLLAMQIKIIMPWALSFASGCMLYVVAEEMIPEMKSDSKHHHGVWAFIIGFIIMMVLDITLG